MTENVTNTQNNTLKLKPLGKDSADSSGHEFMLEMHTDGNNTPLKIGGINIDTLFFHNKKIQNRGASALRRRTICNTPHKSP